MKKFICLVIVIICIFSSVYGFYENAEDEQEECIIETVASRGVPNLNARAAILYDSTYGRILYEKNPHERRANASTTKMITAIVAYECGNLDDIVTISKNAANTGGSVINLRTDDKITLDDLINGLLIHSGNDAATAIAEHISGSVQEFAILMNEKAIEIGAQNSNFVTPHGLDDENHYSTAYDLMLIADYLLKIPYLANIVSKTSAEIEINGSKRTVGTTNEILSYYDGADGVKTGYTGNAGRCIITSATRDGRKLIAVVLGCDTKNNRTNDSIKLLDYGYECFKLVNLQDYVRKNVCISVDKSEGEIYIITKEINTKYPIKDDEITNLRVRYDIASGLVAPLKAGNVVAEAEILLNGVVISRIQYTLPTDIPRKSWKSYFNQIFTKAVTIHI